ncbi:hypothetical protein ACNYDJ_03610 [Phocaeicola vulgatus]|uniref:hypothetical protein n=1 Tax=Phocaeicola vulgatus TaxID=821 RepID=UPI003AB496C5
MLTEKERKRREKGEKKERKRRAGSVSALPAKKPFLIIKQIHETGSTKYSKLR